MLEKLQFLSTQLAGELHFDLALKSIYATDASVYRELPLAVAFPKDVNDLKQIINFVSNNGLNVIPRGAGTSLAGQCVGQGIVVDVSKYFNKIIELNVEESWVKVQPGVVRDELNTYLKDYGLFFGPNTSTANRCTIGGMVGNNSSGTTSIQYATTREHVLELGVIFSDGSEAVVGEDFEPSTPFQKKLVDGMNAILTEPQARKEIEEGFPKASIHRRNTGYALDVLLHQEKQNLASLLCGSEGTLAFTTWIKLSLDPAPKPNVWVVCPHFNSVNEAMQSTVEAMKTNPSACELMDKTILDCTKDNKMQTANRFFVKGDPAALLMIEYRADTEAELTNLTTDVINRIKKLGFGTTFPIVKGADTKKVWALRAAGLGLLANLPGDAKAVACIEDTAVALEDLPAYIDDFGELMKGFGQESVYYAHAGAGEIHLRPILDLKKSKDVELFHDISLASAKLVKKYQGSLSGEHGDGRVRAAFIPMMVGEKNYERFLKVKRLWDPKNIFNPGKIVEAAPMTESLRYSPDQETKTFDTMFDYSDTVGFQRALEKCNGSGDCRKAPSAGGIMCPSYQATRDEKDTTRARANILREVITNQELPFESEEAKAILDLCVSCKGCASDCPSNVNMTTLKAEFMYHYQEAKGYSFRNKMIVNFASFQKMASWLPSMYNVLISNKLSSTLIKKSLGFAPDRSLPSVSKQSTVSWFNSYEQPTYARKVYLFVDEFINWNEAEIGIKTIQLLNKLRVEVKIVAHPESGRAHLSKGFLKQAKALAIENVLLFSGMVKDDCPLIGIEPSAILSFRDEYPRLVGKELENEAKQLAENVFLIDEYLHQLLVEDAIKQDVFDDTPKEVAFHAHCHQKVLSAPEKTIQLLSIPNTHVHYIPSGCCGMAGSFGYEEEHYAVSQQIGNLVLFPYLEKLNNDITIIANGVSCRHQINDRFTKKPIHPVEYLFDHLK